MIIQSSFAHLDFGQRLDIDVLSPFSCQSIILFVLPIYHSSSLQSSVNGRKHYWRLSTVMIGNMFLLYEYLCTCQLQHVVVTYYINVIELYLNNKRKPIWHMHAHTNEFNCNVKLIVFISAVTDFRKTGVGRIPFSSRTVFWIYLLLCSSACLDLPFM